jgi:hypothetical protein
MPVLYMPAIRSMVTRQMTPSEKNLIFALCALVSMHMSGKSLSFDGPASWEDAGRFFLDECVSNRQSYDFMEDMSLNAVISSFWLSTSFFEINQNRKSWLYLREALTLAQDMGLHNDSTYVSLSPQEALCRQRVFWILFVTERYLSPSNRCVHHLWALLSDLALLDLSPFCEINQSRSRRRQCYL